MIDHREWRYVAVDIRVAARPAIRREGRVLSRLNPWPERALMADFVVLCYKKDEVVYENSPVYALAVGNESEKAILRGAVRRGHVFAISRDYAGDRAALWFASE